MTKDLVSHGVAQRRRVSVAGVSGGVGTTTLAVAIDGTDRGVFVGRPVDVLVCRSTVESLQRAAQAARLQSGATGRFPLLAVTATESGGMSRAVSARLRLTAAYAARVVTVPLVRRWRDSTTCLSDARSMLSVHNAELPRALRGYAAAARDVRRHYNPDLPGRHRPTTGPRAASGRSPERTR